MCPSCMSHSSPQEKRVMPELPSSWMFWLVMESQAALPPAVGTTLTFTQGERVGLGDVADAAKMLSA